MQSVYNHDNCGSKYERQILHTINIQIHILFIYEVFRCVDNAQFGV